MAAGGVSESEEEVIISMSGTGGTQTVSTGTWNNVSNNGMSGIGNNIKDSRYGTTSNGSEVIAVTSQAGDNPTIWYSTNDGSNWGVANGVSGINNATSLMTRTDSSNASGPRFMAFAGYTVNNSQITSNDGINWSTSTATTTNGLTPTMAASCNYIVESGKYIMTGRQKNCYTSSDASSGNWAQQSDLANHFSSNGFVRHILGPVINSGANRRILASGGRDVRYNDADGVGGGSGISLSGNTWTNGSGGTFGYGETAAGVWGMIGVKWDGTSNEFVVGDGATFTAKTVNTKPTDQAFNSIDNLIYNAGNSTWYLKTTSNINIWESHDYGTTWYTSNSTPSGWGSLPWAEHTITVSPSNSDTIAVAGGASGSVNVFKTTGPSTSGNSASLNITGDTTAHPGVTQTVTFANGISATDATTQVKALFTGGTIQNYTVTDISSTSFKVTSTATGDETNLSFSTSAGTGGSLSSTLTVTDGAG